MLEDILNFILNPPSEKVEFVMEVTDKTRADVKVNISRPSLPLL